MCPQSVVISIQGDRELRRLSDLPIYISMCHKYSGPSSPPFGDLNSHFNSSLQKPLQRGCGVLPAPSLRLVKCSTHPSAPTLERLGKGPSHTAHSFSTRAAISLKSTLPQVREGGTPSVQAEPLPSALHQLGRLLPPRKSPPPPAAAPSPYFGSLVCAGSPSSRPPCPVSGPLTPQACSELQGSQKGQGFVPSYPESLGAGSFVAILHFICMRFIKYKHA
jgi:hypothetical protein